MEYLFCLLLQWERVGVGELLNLLLEEKKVAASQITTLDLNDNSGLFIIIVLLISVYMLTSVKYCLN